MVSLNSSKNAFKLKFGGHPDDVMLWIYFHGFYDLL